MNISNYLKTWEGNQLEAKFNRFVIGGLILAVLFLASMLTTQDQLVVIQPFSLTEEAWLTKEESSQSYQKAWGFAMATLMGNATPKNVDFIVNNIGPLLDPKIYQDVIEILRVQAQAIKDDKVSMRFEPRTVDYEPSSQKVFIYGYSFIRGATSDEKRSERTYEFQVKINNYAPTFTHFDTYSMRPRTRLTLDKEAEAEERRKERMEKAQ